MAANPEELINRILVLTPIGRDAPAAAQNLAESNLPCVICLDLDDLNAKLREGAAAALVTEEAFLQGSIQALEKWVAKPARLVRLSLHRSYKSRYFACCPCLQTAAA